MCFSCTVLLSKCFTNLIGIPGGRPPAACLMARLSNLVHGEDVAAGVASGAERGPIEPRGLFVSRLFVRQQERI